MPDLRDYQDAFAAALGSADPAPLAPWLGDKAANDRFAVYRNNFVLGCADRLAAAYPAVARLVGEKFFQATAKAYIAAHPPSDPRLVFYGLEFPDFLDGFEPAARLPYLSDVARIEATWTRAHYAPDAAPLTPDAVRALTPARIAALAPGLHGSAGLILSDYPVFSIYRANRADGPPERVALDRGGESALVWRPGREVMTERLSPGETVFLAAIETGGRLDAAGEAALQTDHEFDLAAAFGKWLTRGALGGAAAREGRT